MSRPRGVVGQQVLVGVLVRLALVQGGFRPLGGLVGVVNGVAGPSTTSLVKTEPFQPA